MDRTTVLTVTIPEDTKRRLDDLARDTQRSESEILQEAIEAYLDWDAEYVAAVEEGIRQADAGEFATDEEMAEFWARWRA